MTDQVKDSEEILQDQEIVDSVEESAETTANEEVIEETQAETEEASAEENEVETSEEIVEEEIIKTPEEIIAELENTVLRTRADFMNFRKRSVKDQEDARQRGKISVLQDVLPVYDTFKMAMMATEGDQVNLDMIVQGMNMIQNMFTKAIGDMGIVEINALGQKFDPNLHEAASEAYSDTVEEGVVLTQTRCGYQLGERLMRAAMVTVSKGPEPEVTEEESGEEES